MTGLSARFLVSAGNGGHANDVRPQASALGPDGLPRAQRPLCSPVILSRFAQLLWFFK